MATPAADRIVANRYALKNPLGRGGMGVVWRAQDAVLGREVAVKEVVFPPTLPATERSSAEARVMREARAAARLNHPCAVILYDVVQDEDHPFIVMELVRAPTLAELVRTEGPLPAKRVAEIGGNVASALEAAHRAGIVHRDVKPGNVMVPESGPSKLTDFGIASLQGDPQLTATGLVVGSPAYMAPEQAKGEPSGPSTDFWGLGATMYYAVEGVPAYERGTSLATLAAVVNDDPRPMRRAGQLTPVITALLSKDPAIRLTGPELRAELRRLADGAAPSATQVLPVHRDQPPPPTTTPLPPVPAPEPPTPTPPTTAPPPTPPAPQPSAAKASEADTPAAEAAAPVAAAPGAAAPVAAAPVAAAPEAEPPAAKAGAPAAEPPAAETEPTAAEADAAEAAASVAEVPAAESSAAEADAAEAGALVAEPPAAEAAAAESGPPAAEVTTVESSAPAGPAAEAPTPASSAADASSGKPAAAVSPPEAPATTAETPTEEASAAEAPTTEPAAVGPAAAEPAVAPGEAAAGEAAAGEVPAAVSEAEAATVASAAAGPASTESNTPAPTAAERSAALEELAAGAPERPASPGGERPGPVPPPVVAPGRHGRERLLGGLAVVLAAILIAWLAATFASREGANRSATTTTGSGAGATRSGNGGSSGSTQPPTSGQFPAGWTSFTNRAGGPYTLGIPPGWARSTRNGSTTTLDEPGDGKRQFTVRSKSVANPLPGASEAYRAYASGKFDDYRELSFDVNGQFAGLPAVVYQFEAKIDGDLVHVSHINFKAERAGYNVEIHTPVDQWQSSQELIRQFEQAFRPLG